MAFLELGNLNLLAELLALALLADVFGDERLGLADGLAKSLGRRLGQGGEGTEGAGIADGGSESRRADPLHATLYEGHAQAELFSERSGDHGDEALRNRLDDGRSGEWGLKGRGMMESGWM